MDLKNLEENKRILYSTEYFSGDYNHDLYLKKAKDDGSNKPKYYISAFSNINGVMTLLGYIYFYIDFESKKSVYIGEAVKEEYRNLNIGSFLVASWINFCFNEGYDFLETNSKQKKPFLLYLLKTYGFEILDITLYHTRPDVITICRSENLENKNKYLLFKDHHHELEFRKTNIFKSDNYKIIYSPSEMIILDDIILPLQNTHKNHLEYELLFKDVANEKVERVLNNHKR